MDQQVFDPQVHEGVRMMGVFVFLGLMLLVSFLISIFFRTVVHTNEVHIVQSAKSTVSYGKDQKAGNKYYDWPSWMPFIGVQVIKLPVSVFNVNLNDYAAYDKGRVPFKIDIMAFFRIEDSNRAAQRVKTFSELGTQLQGILQGAIRSILASSEIEQILQGRAEYGTKFTEAVESQLKEWGVTNVKSIELMDIRDADQSNVIANIMAKKKSLIEKESRVEVAENMRVAQEAEIAAKQAVGVRQQESEQIVGQRTAEKNREVGIAQQKAEQQIKEAQKVTTEKMMAVLEVEKTRQADIEKKAQVIAAEQHKDVLVIQAEAEKLKTVKVAEGIKEQTKLVAQGNLEQAKLHAEGIKAEGEAKGAAETAILMAPVSTQITLAKEIGENDGYQTYLIKIEEIKKNQAVGVEQAQALKAAQIKIIANSGDVVSGVHGVMDLFTTKGGTQVGAALEALKDTDAGKLLVEKFIK
jgi:flotillin